MKQTRHLMGMHITIEIVDKGVKISDIDAVYTYFHWVDQTFSPYKKTSEVSRYNRGEIIPPKLSDEMKTIMHLAMQTKKETEGYFDSYRDGVLDPSGIVKGWAIWQASLTLRQKGFRNFYIDAGGDVQVAGTNKGQPWTIGIRNPFQKDQIVKVVTLNDQGIATSGTAERGQHIYNPHAPTKQIKHIVSLTVIGSNVLEADRFATAAFAMGKDGIVFIENQPGLEGYMINEYGIATYTSGFTSYVYEKRQATMTL